jgi:hypothetical protein
VNVPLKTSPEKNNVLLSKTMTSQPQIFLFLYLQIAKTESKTCYQICKIPHYLTNRGKNYRQKMHEIDKKIPPHAHYKMGRGKINAYTDRDKTKEKDLTK